VVGKCLLFRGSGVSAPTFDKTLLKAWWVLLLRGWHWKGWLQFFSAFFGCPWVQFAVGRERE